ncbi:MAG: ABC transporter substrate-binding protein [Pseudomonadota bacterium]
MQTIFGMLTRRAMVGALAALPLVAGLSAAPAAAETVLRVGTDQDLKNLDPIWTTAYVTRNHGYMIYDVLFAMDADFKPQPQMVDTWSTSEDGLVWTFVLRDGLTFHDGAPVTGEDVVASLNRWGQRDGMGQQLYGVIESLEASDDKTVVMTLSEPYGLVLESIGKLSSNVPFIMPARIAATDPFEQITEHVGSGPFVFEEDEWVPGSQVVYSKFADYLPRDEPASNAAGGKVVSVDKVIQQYFPDATTGMNAIMAGEIDYHTNPAPDLAPILEGNPDITVKVTDPLGSIGFARFNHLLPPFDNADVRRAAIKAMKQEDYLASAVGDPQFWKTCYSVYPCGTLLENDTGSDVMATGDVDAAKAALEEAGYDGTEVLIMQPTDIAILNAFSLVTADKLRAAGFNVKLEAMDWATLTSRRALRDPVADGGWNMFHTWWIGPDVADPMAIAFSGNPDAGWFGWAEDAELEEARTAFAKAATLEEKQALGAQVQERLFAIGASGHLGQFFTPVAYRSNVAGIIESPIPLYWNITLE